MAAFVSLEYVKRRLRVDHADDDEVLTDLIESSTDVVINHLKSAADAYLDSGGDVPSGVEIPAAIKTATTMLVGYLYRDPDQDPEKAFGEGELPGPVVVILRPLRDPALA